MYLVGNSFHVSFKWVVKSVQSKRLLIHRVQKSAHVTHFGTLRTGH